MIRDREEGKELQEMESAERRKFLRNALGIGGAAVLLLTAASRQTLAEGLALSQEELEAARRARQTPGTLGRREAGSADGAVAARGELQDCPCTSCTGTCTGGCTSCTGCSGCTASCASGCNSNCSGGCHNGCEGHCTGCSGVNL